MCLVSIIVPNYNHAKFLHERLDSIFRQTYRNFEVIILDDHSTDNSREVIESYRTRPEVSRIVYNEQNSGNTFFQWKKGLEWAKGKYVWIAESDDYADANFLNRLIPLAESVDAGVVYSDSMIVNESSENLYLWSAGMKKYNRFNYWDTAFIKEGRELTKSVHVVTNVIPNASSAVFKKELVDLRLFEEIVQYRYTGDWIFWFELFLNCRVAYINEALNFFRSHQQTTRSVTKSKKSDLEEYYSCILRFRQYLDPAANGLFEENLAFLFKKWHFNSPVYFFKHWSGKRYALASKADPAINSRISQLFLSFPALLGGRLFAKLRQST